MPSIEFTWTTLSEATVVKTIQLQKYRFYRRSNRSVLEYKNGGAESVYHGFTYFLELSWEYLSEAEHEDIMLVVDAIREGLSVAWTKATDFTYLKVDPSTESLYVDIVDDEVVEAYGEWFEKMPFEITFRVKGAVTGVHDDA